jgi:hypothetical protein
MILITRQAMTPPIDSAGCLGHHGAEPFAIEPGAAQHRRHYFICQQILEARLIAAAGIASGHGPLLVWRILCRLVGKHVLIVTLGRKFRGILHSAVPNLSLRSNRRGAR